MSKDKESIQVTIRVRPLSDKQTNQTSQTCIWVQENTNSIYLTADKDKEKKYTFDSVCEKNSQDDMFWKVGKKSTEFCMEGYNCTIFAYGQTGAGKTFTMMGVNPQHQNYYDLRGLVPRTLEYLFSCIDNELRESEGDYNVKCSFIEIYNEQVMDLLNKNSNNLSIREDLKKGVYVEGAIEENINSSEEAMEILRKGSKGRHVGSTHYNEYSSRSHSVFTMEIQSTYIKNGIKTRKTRQFHFIDLAGSERTQKSYGQRLKQGCSINKSLHVLSNVIKALGQASLKNKKQHVNYRDSKLTFLLKDSLDGNSKTHLIANISPSCSSSGETSSTLRFARQVKLIKVNKASINEDSIGSIEDLKNEIRRLRSQLVSYRNKEITNISDVRGETQNSEGNGKMVKILHKYVEQQLEKQTKVQEQVSKLMSKNENLQRGINQYNENQIHLRMIISIYEDKILRLKEAEQFYQTKLSSLEEGQGIEEVKMYYEKERQVLLQQVKEYKNLSSSSKFIKSLLSQLKALNEGQNVDSNLDTILQKNNFFLQEIMESIRKIEPSKKEEKISSEEFEELQMKNEQLLEEIQKITFQLLQVKENFQENENLLKEAIDIQINLEEKLKNANEEKEELAIKLKESKQKQTQLSVQLEETGKSWETKTNEFMIQISQQEVQISQLKNDISKVREKHNFDENILKEKIETLEIEKEEFDRLIKEKTEELHSSKNQFISLQNDYEKFQDEKNNEVQNKNGKILQFEEIVAQLNLEKAEYKGKLQQLKKSLNRKIDEKNEEITQLQSQLSQSKDQNKTISHDFQKEKQLHLMLKEKHEVLIAEFQEEKGKYELKHDELMKMIEENKRTDSQTSQKLSQTQIQMIKLQNTKEHEENKLKKEAQNIKEKLEMVLMQKNQIALEKEEIIQELKMVTEDSKVYREKIKVIDEELDHFKRKSKESEEEIEDLKEKQKNLSENLQKIKEKEKQLKLAFNEQKNQIYALKKNSQVEIQSQKELYKQKNQQFGCLEREHNRAKENFQRSLKQAHKQLQIKEELFISNEQSIKKTMGSLLVNKENKISELTSFNESLNLKYKQQKEEFDKLVESKEQMSNEFERFKVLLQEKEGKLSENQKKLEEFEEERVQMDRKHIDEIQSLEMKNNEEIDEKNAQIQQYLLATQKLEKQCELKSSQLLQYQQEIEELQKKLVQVKEVEQKQTNELSVEILEFKSHLEEKANNIEVLQTKLSCEQEQKENLLRKIEDLQSKFESQISIKTEEKLNIFNTIEQFFSENSTVNTQAMDENLLKFQQKIAFLFEENKRNQEEKQEILREKEDRENQIFQLEKQLQTIINDHAQTHKMLTKKYDEQMKDMDEHNKIVTDIKLRNERLLEEMKEMGAEIRKKTEENSDLKGKYESLNKQFKNKEGEIEEEKMKLSENQVQLENSRQSCEELEESLAEQKKMLQRIHEEQQMTRKQYQIMKQQQNEALKHKEQVIKVMEFEISQERQKVEDLKRYIDYQNTEKEHFSREREKLLEFIQKSKMQIEQTKSKLNTREGDQMFEIEKLTEELKRKEKEENSWKKCIEEWESSLNEAQIKIKSFKRQIVKEKETNKNFRGLIENAECQINQLKLELSEKEISYKKLLEKVSRNEFKGIGSNENQRLSEMLEKSRMELVQTKKMFEDQRKINKALKLQLAQKEDSIESLKANAEEYCRRQQEQMAGIQSDYLKIEEKHQIAEKQLIHHKQELSSLKKRDSRAAHKIEELEDSLRKMNREMNEFQRENEELKKDSLRTGMDERQKIYMNRIKEENNYLKKELDKTKQLLIRESEEKAKLKSEKRYGKDTLSSDLNRQLEKKNTEIKYLQEIINQACNILQIKRDEVKSKYDISRSNLVLSIRNLTKEKHTAKERVEELEEEVIRLTEKVTLYQQHKPRNSSRMRPPQDNLSKQIRTKLTQPLEYSKEDKSILRSMDQNKNQYSWDKY